ncbi:hybrid sensor histidine kinase/response regulator [Caballeronia sp. M1242]|uniref:ATP-binding response regulator n=1 Tax=Caballeronia sp. M1242 TaxID=2814653 RepID=UPI0019D232CB|nr:hybrid sensor histidine kinase/response regulator [Caballeronia sp. M1242]QSN64213.1 hybrid sensor histidine kinase/response regulator [Caballeronia sp. M1242]
MHDDRRKREVDADIDHDVASVLYAADPASFPAHACAIALLAVVYVAYEGDGPLPLFCVLLHGVAICLAIGLWSWRWRRPSRFGARRWIGLHALRNVALYGAPGLSAWFAFQHASAALAAAHIVLLVALTTLAYAANALNALNLRSAMVPLLLPAATLHVLQADNGRLALGVALLIIIVAVDLLASQYRDVHRDLAVARAEQQRLAQIIARQKGVIKEASIARTRFFAAASHDLRQPLHAIGLLAHSLADRRASEAEREATAQHIVDNVEALNHLFNQVLDLARLESGVTQAMPQHFHLSDVLARIEQQFRPAAAAKGLALRIAPTSCVAFTDPVLLERVVANLVSNAVRYTERGAVWIGVRRSASPERCFVEVRDSGIGIAPQEHELVFEEFYQAPLAGRDRREGHGLGLSTVRRLTRLLGGEPMLRSAPGRGTTMRVPVRTGDPSLVTASLVAAPVMSAFIDGRRVLCVDEDPANLEALGALLTRWGCVVRGCPDELAAVRAISEGFVPDVLLCDYRIDSHQTGIEAMQAVREALRRRGHHGLARVLITGDMASPELAALVAEGVPVLHKPVTPTRLRRTLDVLLQPRSEGHEAA